MSTATERRVRMAGRRQGTTYKDAVTEALTVAMAEDDRVILMGEDIAGGAGLGPPLEGAMGGTFGATKGLLETFGADRVRDTPISEGAVVGAAVGAAVAGLRPVVDLMWASFTPYCFDQLFNQAAKLRYMSGGQTTVPAVFRMAVGAGLRAGGQHSDTLFSVFAAVPGLKVVAPATPADAKGLLLSAIRDDDPVVVLEHMSLYRQRGPVPPGANGVPLGVAEVVREGSDVTVVTVSSARHLALEAADRLSAAGVGVEVVDLRSITPLDVDTVLGSVAKTGRLVLVEESPTLVGVSTALAYRVTSMLFHRLVAPPAVVKTATSPVPFSPPLEDAYLPSTDAVVDAVLSVLDDSADRRSRDQTWTTRREVTD